MWSIDCSSILFSHQRTSLAHAVDVVELTSKISIIDVIIHHTVTHCMMFLYDVTCGDMRLINAKSFSKVDLRSQLVSQIYQSMPVASPYDNGVSTAKHANSRRYSPRTWAASVVSWWVLQFYHMCGFDRLDASLLELTLAVINHALRRTALRRYVPYFLPERSPPGGIRPLFATSRSCEVVSLQRGLDA